MKSDPTTHTENSTRREAVLNAAAEVFTEHGYARATIDEVASRAGVAKGSVYTYFKSKRHLFTEVFSHHYPQREAELLVQLRGKSSAADKLQMMFEAWYQHHAQCAQSPLTLEFWQSAIHQDDGMIIDVFRRRYLFWRDLMAEVIAEGIEQGLFRRETDPAVSATILMAIFDGLLVQSMLHVGITLDRTIFDKLVEGILESLTAGPTPTDEEKE